ncbi:extracellular calcium-sensing receptor-like isoform X2 [Petromyzon marinus]|uniref:extracellular calcium-sensing receptor-like isoform X2 n=1 Tax=Petromyzon marinus TaxID=7757 RepID=UPI003F70E539
MYFRYVGNSHATQATPINTMQRYTGCIQKSREMEPLCLLAIGFILLHITPHIETRLFIESGGDVILGGMFPLHNSVINLPLEFNAVPTSADCVMLNERALTRLYTMLYTIEEINNRSDLLPNMKLGYRVIDSCTDVMKAVEASYEFSLSGSTQKPPLVVIGDAYSFLTIPAAYTLGLKHIPMISYSASAPSLSDKTRFPTFMRTIPSDTFQSKALAELVGHFGWTWIGILGSDDDYGRQGLGKFQSDAHEYGVCTDFQIWVPKKIAIKDINSIVNVIQNSTVKVIIAFVIDAELEPIIKEMARRQIVGKTFIASESWISSPVIHKPQYADVLEGTIGFDMISADMNKLSDFLRNSKPTTDNPFMTELWQETFHCTPYPSGLVDAARLPACSGDESLGSVTSSFFNPSEMTVPYAVYLAVYAVAHALHELTACTTWTSVFAGGHCANLSDIQPWQVMRYLKKVDFKDNGYNIRFDANGDPVAYYILKQWQRKDDENMKMVAVGSYTNLNNNTNSTNKGHLIINDELLIWMGKQLKAPDSLCVAACPEGSKKEYEAGQPSCCYRCVQCSDGEFSKTKDANNCMRCPPDSWSTGTHTDCFVKPVQYLKWDSVEGLILHIAAIIGIFLTFDVLFIFYKYRETPIVKASNFKISLMLLICLFCNFLCIYVFVGIPKPWMCIARQPFFGVSFSSCLSCILVKTISMIITFKPSLTRNNTFHRQMTRAEIPIVAVVIVIEVALCVVWYFLASPSVFRNENIKADTIFLQCDEGSPLNFAFIIAYLYVLALICLMLSFMVRKLPNNFNEGKFVMFSALTFFIVWISFIPAYILSNEHRVVVEVISIILSGYGILIFLFFHKCYIILFQPQKNTKEHLDKQLMEFIQKAVEDKIGGATATHPVQVT